MFELDAGIVPSPLSVVAEFVLCAHAWSTKAKLAREALTACATGSNTPVALRSKAVLTVQPVIKHYSATVISSDLKC